MNRVRKRRMIFLLLVLAAAAIAAALMTFALQRNLNYMFTPSEVDAGKSPVHAQFRLGGIVKKGSVDREHDSLEIKFVVTDSVHTMPVTYTGILPDLFREGQSVIATGHMQHGTFIATKVLAKHDSTYMPPEVAKAIKKAKHVQQEKAASVAHHSSQATNG